VGKRNVWRRRHTGYYDLCDLIVDGGPVATAWLSFDGRWSWKLYGSNIGGHERTLHKAKAAMIAALDDNDGQA
jgi:hypothetical protein